MRISSSDAPAFWSLLCVLALLAAASPSRAHDVEPVDDVEDLPAEDHIACDVGLAGRYPCFHMELVEFVPRADFGDQALNDLWGWTDPLTGVEYVIVGIKNATVFFELNSHGHPILRGTLPTRTVPSSWRDVKVHRDHAFIVSEAAAHGMQVFDLTRLREDSGAPETYTSDAEYLGFTSAHNIAINEETGFAYAVGTNTCGGGLHMIDIESPTLPRFAGCFSEDGYTHDTQCVVYRGPDLDFVGREICLSSNEDTVTIADVTDKAAPILLSRVPYYTSRYAHQGWLTEDHEYFLLDDELDELGLRIHTRTIVWDVSNLRAPRITGAHYSSSTAIDHNQYIRGNHVFQANYRAGVRILRIGDLAQAELAEVAYFDTSPATDRPVFGGTWSVYPYFESGYIAASDIGKGLFILRPDLAGVAECSDGIDNDGDGLRDHPEDPTCVSPEHASERIRLDIEIATKVGFSQQRIEFAPHGIVHLAILGSLTVDVEDVELASLRLGPAGASPAGPNEKAQTTGQHHFDDDAFEDRVIKFRMDEIGLEPDASEICLEGVIGDESFVACLSLVEADAEEGDHESAAHVSIASTAKALPALSGWGLAALIVQLCLVALYSWRTHPGAIASINAQPRCSSPGRPA